MTRQKTLTRSNTQIRIVDERTAVVFNDSHELEVRFTNTRLGAHVNRDDLVAIRESGDANWSDDEISDIAYQIECRVAFSS